MNLDQAHGLRARLGAPSTERSGSGRRGQVLAVVSGKGGVGKTMVSVNLAVIAARRGLRTLIVDGDVGLANADILLGVRPQRTLLDVLAGRCGASDAIVRGADGVALLAGGSEASQLARGPAELSRLQTLLAELGRGFDRVIIDCGAGIAEPVLQLAALADERMVVVTPEPTALVDGYAMAKAVSDAGLGHAQVVVNFALTLTEAESCFHRLEAVAARFLPLRLRFAGGIPRDEAVRRAVMRRRPVVQDEPTARVSLALSQLDGRLGLAAARAPADAVAP